jgi:hypothetical protein
LVLWVFFSGLLQPAVLYVIIIQNETNDIRQLERPCLLLWVSNGDAVYFAFGAFVMEPTLQFFIRVAFYTPYFLGKKSVFKIR